MSYFVQIFAWTWIKTIKYKFKQPDIEKEEEFITKTQIH